MEKMWWKFIACTWHSNPGLKNHYPSAAQLWPLIKRLSWIKKEASNLKTFILQVISLSDWLHTASEFGRKPFCWYESTTWWQIAFRFISQGWVRRISWHLHDKSFIQWRKLIWVLFLHFVIQQGSTKVLLIVLRSQSKTSKVSHRLDFESIAYFR